MTSPYDPPQVDEDAPEQSLPSPIDRGGLGRWYLVRRAGAFVVDWLLLAAFGWMVGAAFTDGMTQLSWRGPFIGLALVIVILAVLDSRVTGGRTLGKMFFGLRVVDSQGNPPAWPQALLRAVIVSCPLVLNGIQLPGDYALAGDIVGALIFGVGPVVVLLPLFSRTTGAFGFHDLATGTRVIEALGTGPLPAPSRYLLPASGAWCLVILVGYLLPNRGAAPAVLQRLRTLAAQEGLVSLSIGQDQMHFIGTRGSDDVRSVQIVAWSERGPERFRRTASVLAHSACELVPDLDKARFIQVTVRYGWTLGIAKNFETMWMRAGPATVCANATVPDAGY